MVVMVACVWGGGAKTKPVNEFGACSVSAVRGLRDL